MVENGVVRRFQLGIPLRDLRYRIRTDERRSVQIRITQLRIAPVSAPFAANLSEILRMEVEHIPRHELRHIMPRRSADRKAALERTFQNIASLLVGAAEIATYPGMPVFARLVSRRPAEPPPAKLKDRSLNEVRLAYSEFFRP